MSVEFSEFAYLSSRWASGDVDVDRNDSIGSAEHRVGVVVVSTAVGTRSHRNDPLGLGHLIVDAAESGRHLVGDGSRDEDQVGLKENGTFFEKPAASALLYLLQNFIFLRGTRGKKLKIRKP